MKKKLLVLLLTSVMLIITACGSSTASSEPEIPDLKGTWRSKDNAGSYQEAVIDDTSIEINWVSDGGDTKSIYWVGTFVVPTEATDSYTWISERDKEATDFAILASTDDTKEFTYKNGVLSYETSALGTTKTMELTKE